MTEIQTIEGGLKRCLLVWGDHIKKVYYSTYTYLLDFLFFSLHFKFCSCTKKQKLSLKNYIDIDPGSIAVSKEWGLHMLLIWDSGFRILIWPGIGVVQGVKGWGAEVAPEFPHINIMLRHLTDFVKLSW